MKVSGSALCHWSARSFALNTNCCSLMLVAGRQQLPPSPVVAAHLKFDEVPWGWCLSSEVFSLPRTSIITFVSFLFYANGSKLERSLPLLTRHRSEARGDDSSGNSRTICCIRLHGNQNVPLQMSLPALLHADPGQMQVYSTLNSHSLNAVLDHEEAVASVPQTWNWFSCLVKCIADFTRAGVSVPSAPAVRFPTCAFDGLGNSLSFLWLRENDIAVSFVCTIITLSLLCC